MILFKRFARGVIFCSCLLPGLNAFANEKEHFLPQPKGPYEVGVRDFDFIDSSREETFKPGSKRRIMARVWYPATATAKKTRPYYTEKEFTTVVEQGAKVMPSSKQIDTYWRTVRTHSYENAPLSNTQSSYPLLIFSHGGFAYVGFHTVLMEHLASFGYIVVSVTHPYLSTAVMFSDGSAIPVDALLSKAVLKTISDKSFRDHIYSDALELRYTAKKDYLASSPLVPHCTEWRDDMIAVVDRFEHKRAPEALMDIVNHSDLSRLGYFGMSFGGCAASAAAHVDQRAKAAINLDGGNHYLPLWNAQIRAPLLIMHHDEDNGKLGIYTEFDYETFLQAGLREDVVRVLVKHSTHGDFTDNSALPTPIRQQLSKKGVLGNIENNRMTNIMNDWVKAFFDRYVLGNAQAFPASLYTDSPEVTRFDMSHIRHWAESDETR